MSNISTNGKNQLSPKAISGLRKLAAKALAANESTLISRSQLAKGLGQQFGDKRDIYSVLGYKIGLDFDDYYNKYDRQDIANRIVDAPASATWRRTPEVIEDDEVHRDSTDFERAWSNFNRAHKALHALERVDRISGIGRYGILLIGLRGQKNLSTEARSVDSPNDVIYLSVYSEGSAEIHSFVEDPTDPRFGKPLLYRINLTGSFERETNVPIKTVDQKQVLVHHSRVLHVAEGKTEDDVFGRPRLRSVYNLLDDLEKVVGASAEMFWQGAYRGLHLDVNPEYQPGDLDPEEEQALKNEVDEFVHGLTRVIRTQGVEVKTLEGEVADPRGVFEVILDLLAGTTKIPKRILIGSERGELASAQDEANWNARIKERQEQYAEPEILRPFIDTLVGLDALPSPPEPGYKVVWPSLFEKSEKERADTALSWARTFRQIMEALERQRNLGDKKLVGISELRSIFLGLDPNPPPDGSEQSVPENPAAQPLEDLREEDEASNS